MPRAEPGLNASETTSSPKRFLRIRLRYWAVLIAAVFVVASLVLAYEFTLQPDPPFHQQWNRQFAGNSFGNGTVVGNVYVTYEATATVFNQSKGTTSTSYSLEGVNTSDGQTVWFDSPFSPITPIFGPPSPTMLNDGPYAVLAVEYARQSTSGFSLGLSLNAVNSLTGQLTGSYNNTVAPSGNLDPSTGMTLTGSALVMWFTTWVNVTTTTFDVIGLSFPSLQFHWNFSVTLPGGDGWSSLDSAAASSDGDALMEVATGTNVGNATLFLINGTTSHMLLTRPIPSSAMGGSTVLGGSLYYLNQTASSLWISSINLTSGDAGTPIAVRNVGDTESQSAGLFGTRSVLVVASYSPSLSYAAYSVTGSELWQIAFPWSTSCGPHNNLPAVGPCTTVLVSPVEVTSGSVLLESLPTVFYSGSTYTEQFDLVNATTGAVSWQYGYTFSFGEKYLPWQSPEASFEVLFSVGNQFLYTVITPTSQALGCGKI